MLTPLEPTIKTIQSKHGTNEPKSIGCDTIVNLPILVAIVLYIEQIKLQEVIF